MMEERDGWLGKGAEKLSHPALSGKSQGQSAYRKRGAPGWDEEKHPDGLLSPWFERE